VPEECRHQRGTIVRVARERTLIVGGELNHFGRKKIDTVGDIFILLKHINNKSS
jgi:hypothetical protein